MSEPDPTADTAHECLGVSPDAAPEEVKLAAARAKSQFNPDNYTEAEKRAARDRFHVVRAAEDALLADGEFPPERVSPPSAEALTVRAARDQITPGASVTVAVRVDDTPADEGVVRAGGVTAPIRNGRATLTPAPTNAGTEQTETATEPPDEVTLTATVGGATATTTVTVAPNLVVEPAETTVTAGDTLSVRVTDGRENPVDGHVETPDGRERLTDGKTRVTLAAPGEQTLTAVAGDRTGTATVTVTPQSGAIGLALGQTTVRVGKPLRVAVRRQSDGRLVSHATVESADGRSWAATDGRVRIRPTEPGQFRLTARRETAGTVTTTDSRTVTVVPSSVELAVSAPATVETDEQFDVTVLESTGDPATGVRVVARREGKTVAETVTDDRGQARLAVTRPGSYTLRATDDRPQTEVLPATRELTVVADASALAVEVVDPPTATSRRCRVVVRDEWGRRVPGATVSVAGRASDDGETTSDESKTTSGDSGTTSDESGTTDERGSATVTVGDGRRELTVVHPTDHRTQTTLTVGEDSD